MNIAKENYSVLKKCWTLPLALVLFASCAGETPEDLSANPPGQTEPWTQGQLMPIPELVEIIENPSREKPLILDIGGVGHFMGGQIKGARLIGPTSEAENLAKLKAVVAEYPTDIDLVLYCGCCPFEDCPNIRPAFRALLERELTNLQLLDIPQNLRIDWVNLGHPLQE